MSVSRLAQTRLRRALPLLFGLLAASPASGDELTGEQIYQNKCAVCHVKPLEPFRNRTLVLHGVCDKVRGDGDNHMRGIGCLLTGIELFPGNVLGGCSEHPAGWSRGASIDQEIKNFLQSRPETRTRFGSLEFVVLRQVKKPALRALTTLRTRRSSAGTRSTS